jgi:hypothetical protein
MVMLYADSTGVGRVEFPDWQCTKLGDLIKYIQDQLSSEYVVKVDQFGRFQLEGKGTCCDVGFSSGLISLLELPAYDDTITIASFRRRAKYREVFEEFWKNGENLLDKDEHLFAIDWTSTKDQEIVKLLDEYLDDEKLKTVTMFNKLANQINGIVNNNAFGGSTVQYQMNISLFLVNFKAFYGSEDCPGKVIAGEYMPRMSPVLQLHIYSNIIQPVDVNDSTARLMKIVNIRGVQGSMTEEVLTHPTYQPVEKTRKISMIHIYI